MKNSLNSKVQVTESADELFPAELINDENHDLTVSVDSDKCYASMHFSSRLAMYQFALSLLQESVYGSGGQKEFYPFEQEGHSQVIDGVRMNSRSARLFISYME
jgi:hypothetical protein